MHGAGCMAQGVWCSVKAAHSHSSCCSGTGASGISVMGFRPSHRCFSRISRSVSGGAYSNAAALRQSDSLCSNTMRWRHAVEPWAYLSLVSWEDSGMRQGVQTSKNCPQAGTRQGPATTGWTLAG